MYFNINFNVFFKIKLHLLVSELYSWQTINLRSWTKNENLRKCVRAEVNLERVWKVTELFL